MYLVFDVESIGLYGEGFAVGAVVCDDKGLEMAAYYTACPQEAAQGEESDRQWILENVVPHLPKPNCQTPEDVRNLFWNVLQEWITEGASVWVDCGTPVEANFLRMCVADTPEERTWSAPYPLQEIATALTMANVDPLGTYDRLPSELPAHNPVNDARQSARMLFEAKQRIGGKA